MIPKVLYLFPAEVIEEEIRRIKIHRASEERKRGESASVIKAVDRGFGIEEENCHVSSGATGNSWLSFEIAWSLITHVNILVPNTAGMKLGLNFPNRFFLSDGRCLDCLATPWTI